ncbi:MAG TPA: hypothetical protein VKP13_17155 [Nitrospira sp.]|nr:hypothetical protein [Nitrospira sp.]
MARAKPERSRSKTAAIDDLNQSIEQLQAFLPNMEDLGREGFPYLEGARARTELQLRECIKRAFGEKSSEYQTHRYHKLSFGSSAETKATVTLIKTLIATLEDKKLELQGLKSTPSQEPPATPPTPIPPTRPPMTLVPPATPTATVTIASATPVIPPPITMSVPLATNVDVSSAVPAPSTVPAPPSAAATAPVEPANPRQPVASPPPRTQQVGPDPNSTLFQTQETRPLSPSTQQAQQPVSSPSPAPVTVAASQPAPPASSSPAVSMAGAQPQPVTVLSEALTPKPAPDPTALAEPLPSTPPATAPSQHSTTQEIPLSARPTPADAIAPPRISTAGSSPFEQDHLEIAKKILQRFHAVARQLRLRGEYRATLDVEDEFDVQDLLHALLRLQFDDITTDEWTPGYTNGAARTTFLLNHDRLAIIVKKTRTGLSAKDLADQVRVDIERYRARERCTTLLCFIYDPEGRIGNPRGLENELTIINDDFTTEVLVAPK